MEFKEAFRELYPFERQLLERLFEPRFPGRDQLEEQVKACKVRTIDEHGCLEFWVSNDIKAPVEHRVPVEAESDDENGEKLHMLLHVVNGQLNELEFYTESGSPIGKIPSAEKWNVIVLPAPPF